MSGLFNTRISAIAIHHLSTAGETVRPTGLAVAGLMQFAIRLNAVG